jgi:cysteine desulfurase
MSDAPPVYLDYNATTPIAEPVRDAMRPYLETHFGNPSSRHPYGAEAREAVARARRQVASLVGASPEEIYFTGSGTEADNLAIRGVWEALDDPERLAISSVEHPAVEEPARWLASQGVEVTRLPVGRDCRVSEEGLRTLEADTSLISVMHANNEVGSIQPIERVVERARELDGLVHTDAAQTVGKIPVDVDDLGVDLMTIVGHKLYAPKGVGALYVCEGTPIEPVLRGGGHERGLRPGTENVPYIVGLGRACKYAEAHLEERQEHMRTMRDELWQRSSARLDDLAWTAREAPLLPNTLHVRFPGVRGDLLLEKAEAVAASTGSACHEGEEASHDGVLAAMGLGVEETRGAVRLSVGATTPSDDVRRAAESLADAHRRLV